MRQRPALGQVAVAERGSQIGAALGVGDQREAIMRPTGPVNSRITASICRRRSARAGPEPRNGVFGSDRGEERLYERRKVRVRYIPPDAADFEPCWPVLRRSLGDIRPAATMTAAGLSDPHVQIGIEITARRRSEETGQA